MPTVPTKVTLVGRTRDSSPPLAKANGLIFTTEVGMVTLVRRLVTERELHSMTQNNFCMDDKAGRNKT